MEIERKSLVHIRWVPNTYVNTVETFKFHYIKLKRSHCTYGQVPLFLTLVGQFVFLLLAGNTFLVFLLVLCLKESECGSGRSERGLSGFSRGGVQLLVCG